MVRFIFVCMTFMAVALLSIPVTSVYDGIKGQREVNTADATQAADQAPEQTIVFETTTDEPSADDLNSVETAAGGFEDTVEDTSNFSAGFSGTAPAALESEPVDVTTTPVDQAN
jgi:hypothetical protein